MIITCDKCGTKIQLTLEALASEEGSFSCPSCGAAQSVEFGSRRKPTSTRLKREDLTKKRVLVVDDNRYFREMMSDLLREIALVEVLTAGDGEEGLRILKHELPDLDLLILDLEMPNVDGFQVLEQLRSGRMGQNLPVLVITSMELNVDQIHLLRDQGCEGAIAKDTPIDELETRLRRKLLSE